MALTVRDAAVDDHRGAVHGLATGNQTVKDSGIEGFWFSLLLLSVQAAVLVTGQIQLGALTQSVAAFGAIQDALSFFRNSYDVFAGYRASILRLHGLVTANEQSRALPKLDIEADADGAIDLDAVEVRSPGDNPDEVLRAALEAVALPRYLDRLSDEADWAKVLSLGEQQRIAFARVLLTKPRAVFLDEATSALDEPLEFMIYSLVRRELPETVFVSITHRSTVNRHHQMRLELLGGGQWRFGRVEGARPVPV